VEKASLERVEEELAFAREIYRRLRCPVIDITRLSVHEVVGKIFEQIKKKREEQA
jgi:regulator of PEP synthase PpsR (kinase-PPPase family)